jgi:hypothetical protein
VNFRSLRRIVAARNLSNRIRRSNQTIARFDLGIRIWRKIVVLRSILIDYRPIMLGSDPSSEDAFGVDPEVPVGQIADGPFEPLKIKRDVDPGLNPEGIDKVDVEPLANHLAMSMDQFMLHAIEKQAGLRLTSELPVRDFSGNLAKLGLHRGVGFSIIAQFHTTRSSGEATFDDLAGGDVLKHLVLLFLMEFEPWVSA